MDSLVTLIREQRKPVGGTWAEMHSARPRAARQPLRAALERFIACATLSTGRPTSRVACFWAVGRGPWARY